MDDAWPAPSPGHSQLGSCDLNQRTRSGFQRREHSEWRPLNPLRCRQFRLPDIETRTGASRQTDGGALMQEAPYIEPFYAWQAEEGIPIHTGLLIEDLDEVELQPWERMGGRGAFINMGTKPGSNTSAYVREIPGGRSQNPH